MTKQIKSAAAIVIVAIGLSGCTQLSAEQAFLEVSDNVLERTGRKILWNTGSPEDLHAQDVMKSVLSRPLTAKNAIQIALLNNKELQASYTKLGVAQADLVQAGLLRNPILDGAITFPEGVSTPNLTFGLAIKFIEILWIPLKREIAQSELESVKIEISGMVIDMVATTHNAYIDYVAARQQVELFQQVIRSTRATVEAAKSLREAGNITALQFNQQKNILTLAKLDLAKAEANEVEMREKLNVLMGLSSADTEWRAPKRLPALPRKKLSTAQLEKRAIENSLDLAKIKQELITLATKYQLTREQSLLPDLEVGAEYERDDGERQYGPTFEIEIPIFDMGEAKRSKAKLEIEKLRNQYWALGIKVRSTSRLLRARLLTARKTISYYQRTVLPENKLIVSGMQRDYNAMQAGVFQLITSKRQQIIAGQQYIEAQQAYWRSRIAYQQLIHGRLPGNTGGSNINNAVASVDNAEGGH